MSTGALQTLRPGSLLRRLGRGGSWWVVLPLLWALPGAAGVFRLGPPSPPVVRRVVTLAPSLTEMVLALGKGSVLVGVSRFDEAPGVKGLARVGGFVDPSIEAVVALKPDLLLVQPSPGNQRAVEKLAELGVPVLALPLQSVADVLEGLRAVGQALGVPAAGERCAARIESARASVRASAQRLPHPRVLLVYGFEPLSVAGRGAFADELLVDAGGVNVASGSKTPYPTWSFEEALKARPEVVVDSAHVSSGRERLEQVLGRTHPRWVTLATQDLLHPGPRLAEGLRELFSLLHPDAVAP